MSMEWRAMDVGTRAIKLISTRYGHRIICGNCQRCRLRSAQLFGLLVDAHAAGAVGDDVEESARHHQILVEIYHVSLIADRQMHAKGGAETEKNEQGRRPPCLEADKERQAAEEMDGDGD